MAKVACEALSDVNASSQLHLKLWLEKRRISWRLFIANIVRWRAFINTSRRYVRNSPISSLRRPAASATSTGFRRWLRSRIVKESKVERRVPTPLIFRAAKDLQRCIFSWRCQILILCDGRIIFVDRQRLKEAFDMARFALGLRVCPSIVWRCRWPHIWGQMVDSQGPRSQAHRCVQKLMQFRAGNDLLK